MRAIRLRYTRRTWTLLNDPEDDGEDAFVLSMWDLPVPAISQRTSPSTDDVEKAWSNGQSIVEAKVDDSG